MVSNSFSNFYYLWGFFLDKVQRNFILLLNILEINVKKMKLCQAFLTEVPEEVSGGSISALKLLKLYLINYKNFINSYTLQIIIKIIKILSFFREENGT